MYSPETPIVFIYTGERGIIKGHYPDGTYKVRLFDGELIPAFPEDIVLESEFEGIQKPAFQKKEKNRAHPDQFIKKSSADQFFDKSEQDDIEKTYDSLNPDGVKNPYESNVKSGSEAPGLYALLQRVNDYLFVVHLINNTNSTYRFKFSVSHGGSVVQALNHDIDPHTFFPIGEIRVEMLHEGPQLRLEIESIKFIREFRVKGRHLSRQAERAPLCGLKGVLLLLFETPPVQKKEKTLPTISADHLAKIADKERVRIDVYQTERFAAFPKDIDLHLNKLVADTSKIEAHAALALQLKAFNSFFYEAIHLGVRQFYVIHGIGAGKLKEEIHKILRNNPNVISFRNEYFEKYGHGATEVNL